MGHPSEVDEIFDAISYSKGASVIRMLHDYTGDEVNCWRIFYFFLPKTVVAVSDLLKLLLD